MCRLSLFKYHTYSSASVYLYGVILPLSALPKWVGHMMGKVYFLLHAVVTFWEACLLRSKQQRMRFDGF